MSNSSLKEVLSHLATDRTIMRPSWDEIHMYRTIAAATRSSCLKRAVGAGLIKDKREIASGYSGAPEGVTTCLEHKYCYYEDLAWQESKKGNGEFEVLREQYKIYCTAVHAEANALGQCSRFGTSAAGTTLFITNFPCPGCVRDHIITNKIEEVRVWKQYLSNPLLVIDEKRESERLLLQAGISIKEIMLSDERIMEIAFLMTRVGSRTDYEFKLPE